MKVDICIVTKNRKATVKGLEHVPLNRLIVETSRPLGMARKRAIEKVTTDWFAFVDDDVSLFPSWFSVLSSHLSSEIGAISGYLVNYGYGEEIDEMLSRLKPILIEYQKGERWTGTHHGLIRREAISDWSPSRDDLSSWEDFEITNHILKKGYKVVRIPIYLGKHHKSWIKLINNSVWNLKGERQAKGEKRLARNVFRSAFQIIHVLFMPWSPRIKLFFILPRYVRLFYWLYSSLSF